MGRNKKGKHKNIRGRSIKISGISRRMGLDTSLETTEFVIKDEKFACKSNFISESSDKYHLDSVLLVAKNAAEPSKIQTHVKRNKKRHPTLVEEKPIFFYGRDWNCMPNEVEQRKIQTYVKRNKRKYTSLYENLKITEGDYLQNGTTVSEIENREISLEPENGICKSRWFSFLRSDNLCSSNVKTVESLKETKPPSIVSELDLMRKEKKHEGHMIIALLDISSKPAPCSSSENKSTLFYTYRRRKKICSHLNMSDVHTGMEISASEATPGRSKWPSDPEIYNSESEPLFSGSYCGSNVTDSNKLEKKESFPEVSPLESTSLEPHMELFCSKASPEINKAPKEEMTYQRRRKRKKLDNNVLEENPHFSDSSFLSDIPVTEKFATEMSLSKSSQMESSKNNKKLQVTIDDLVVASPVISLTVANDNSLKKKDIKIERTKISCLTYKRKKRNSLSRNNPDYNWYGEDLDHALSSASNVVNDETKRSSVMFSAKKVHGMLVESHLTCKTPIVMKNYSILDNRKNSVITYQRKKTPRMEVFDKSETISKPGALSEKASTRFPSYDPPSPRNVYLNVKKDINTIKTSIRARKTRWNRDKAEPLVDAGYLQSSSTEDKSVKPTLLKNAAVIATSDKEANNWARCPASPELPISHTTMKKLLILDLNGLLVDIVPYTPYGYKADKRIANKFLFKRPFCDGFLKFCFERFDVGVWSSRLKRNVDSVVDYLLGDMKDMLLFCWDQSHCTETKFWTIENRNKPLVFKELKKLWNQDKNSLPWVKGFYNESNTLLLDDSPYKALRNPPNTAIFPQTYSFQDANDTSLGQGGDLRNYLEGLVVAQNVQKYVEQYPFGQNAITSRHPSWDFYLKVIEACSEYPHLPSKQ